MIDSIIWKEKLQNDLKVLLFRKSQKKWSNRSIALFERELMLIFFSIRALIENGKLTDKISKKKYPCITYENLGKIVDDLSKYNFWELYDLDSGKKANLKLSILTNQFIHSYLFVVDFSQENHLNGVLLCSDWQKKESLVEITMDSMINIVEDIINDEVSSVLSVRSSKTGEMRKKVIN